MKSVKGKNVLITGAAMGMGRLFAERAIAEGAAAVVLLDVDESTLNATLEELAAHGGDTSEISGYVVDVSDADMDSRASAWTAPPFKASSGTLWKYIQLVEDASHGCVTDG